MKKLFYTLTFCSSLFLTAQTAGVFLGEGDNNGKSFKIGTNASVETVKKIAKDYSSKDVDAMMSNYTKEFSEKSYGLVCRVVRFYGNNHNGSLHDYPCKNGRLRKHNGVNLVRRG